MSATLGQLMLSRDGAHLRARTAMPWPQLPGREHELTAEQQSVLAEYRALDEQVRLRRHQVLVATSRA